MKWVGSGGSSRTSVRKIMASYPPPPWVFLTYVYIEINMHKVIGVKAGFGLCHSLWSSNQRSELPPGSWFALLLLFGPAVILITAGRILTILLTGHCTDVYNVSYSLLYSILTYIPVQIMHEYNLITQLKSWMMDRSRYFKVQICVHRIHSLCSKRIWSLYFTEIYIYVLTLRYSMRGIHCDWHIFV